MFGWSNHICSLTKVIKWSVLFTIVFPSTSVFVCEFISPCLHHLADVYLELSDTGAVSVSSKYHLPPCHTSSWRWKLGWCDLIPCKPRKSDNSLEREHTDTHEERKIILEMFFFWQTSVKTISEGGIRASMLLCFELLTDKRMFFDTSVWNWFWWIMGRAVVSLNVFIDSFDNSAWQALYSKPNQTKCYF